MTLIDRSLQTPLSMGFCRQEYWSGLPCPSPGDLPDPGIEPAAPVSSALQADSLSTEPPGKHVCVCVCVCVCVYEIYYKELDHMIMEAEISEPQKNFSLSLSSRAEVQCHTLKSSRQREISFLFSLLL